MAGFNEAPIVQRLAIPAVTLLIAFLGYTSQWLFFVAGDLAPGPLPRQELILFNALLLCLWWTYYRACTVPSGEYRFADQVMEVPDTDADPLARWCKKCAAPKPPRAHHCRHCQRCIPRMDHHCPWTANCVSLTTFPHFFRFLVYTNLSLWTLGYFLYQRFAALWATRSLPAYLGPSLSALIHLTILSIVCFFVSFALLVLLVSTAKSWALNMTMIEMWELERHESLSQRGGSRDWWSMTGPDGKKIPLEKVEFPYDVGIFANFSQAMGTSNPLLWFFPFAGNPTVAKDGKGIGWVWPENGFNRREGMWPPIDPEKLRRAARGSKWPGAYRNAEDIQIKYTSPEDEVAAFKARQAADMRRWQGQRSRLMAELEEVEDYDMIEDEEYSNEVELGVGTGWSSADGDRLRDFGVDEDAESINEEDEDIPLGELLRRRKASQHKGNDRSEE